MALKVFRMNEVDWVAASSLDEAKAWYKDSCGVGDEEVCEAYELTEEQMLMLKHWGDEDEQREKPVSFKEELAMNIKDGTSFPCVFASTEY